MKNNSLTEEDKILIQKYHILLNQKDLKLASKPLSGSIP